jgi:hypothetical protein
MTVHDYPLLEGEWWACHFPERPHDTWAVYDEHCRACVIALAAAAMWMPDGPLSETSGGIELPMAAIYEQERHRHDLPPLPARPARTATS